MTPDDEYQIRRDKTVREDLLLMRVNRRLNNTAHRDGDNNCSNVATATTTPTTCTMSRIASDDENEQRGSPYASKFNVAEIGGFNVAEMGGILNANPPNEDLATPSIYQF